MNYPNVIKDGVIGRKSPIIEGCNKCKDKEKELKKYEDDNKEMHETIMKLRQTIKERDEELKGLKQNKAAFEVKEEKKEEHLPS